MIGIAYKLESFVTSRVTGPADRAIVSNLSHAAALIRKRELESIIEAEGPSRPGTPPHTHSPGIVKTGKRKGQRRQGVLQKAIVFVVDKAKQEAVIGPRFSVAGTSGSAHEFGGQYKKQVYPERPFAAPALEQNLDRFAGKFAGSIGG